MTGAIVVCADDYALTAPVSRAILTLAERGRISALSCMTASPLWPEHGRWLASLKDKVDIGLHLTLVDETPLTAMPKTAPRGKLPAIGSLIAKSYAGVLALDEIESEIAAQVKSFIDVTGVPPAHLDGHLHAHVLPGIRDLVLHQAARLTPRPWLRNVHDTLSNILRRGIAVPKAVFISTLGSEFAKDANLDGHTNDSFSGVYAFSGGRDYAGIFPRFVEARARRHVILCHPGEPGDPAAAWDAARAAEFGFFASAAYPEFLERQNLRLARFAAA